MLRAFAAGALLLTVVVLVLAPWRATDRDPNSRTPVNDGSTTVTVAKARPAIEVVRIDALGSAEAVHSVTLFPASAGEIVALNFSAGDRFEQGQVLVELDARDQRLALELANARLDDAERLLDRYRRGGSEAAFTASQIDAASIAVAEARIARDRAQVALDDRFIKAPFAGTVGLSDLDPGDRVTTSTPIASLDDRSELRIRFAVPETYLGQLTIGSPVELTPWTTATSVPTIGRVDELDSRIDAQTRTFTVIARVDNEADRWRPGMSFRVRLDLLGEQHVEVPELALQWGAAGAYVWLVDEQSRARRTAVALVQRRDGHVLIDAEIETGQSVVLEGVQKMADGRLVEVLANEFFEQRDTGQALSRPLP